MCSDFKVVVGAEFVSVPRLSHSALCVASPTDLWSGGRQSASESKITFSNKPTAPEYISFVAARKFDLRQRTSGEI